MAKAQKQPAPEAQNPSLPDAAALPAPDIAVELWPADRPQAYAKNARKIPESAITKVAASIREFGWRQPIVVAPDGVVIAGHTRLLAARRLNIPTVPVHVAVGLTEAQIKAYRLADNRSHEEATWDRDLLGAELGDLGILNFDLALTGFEPSELADLAPRPAPAAQVDRLAELNEKYRVQRGQVWQLGRHRLICGDATNKDDVGRLLAGAAPSLCVTDPPYVRYDPTWRDGKGGFSTAPVRQSGTVENDDICDWTPAWQLFSGAVIYSWHAALFAIETGQSLRAAGFELRASIVWRKQQAVFSRGHYHWQHEPCWYAVRKGQTASWCGGHKESTVWDIASLNPTGNRKEQRLGHGTQKPLECMARPIENHTRPGESVYDPFLGSGTTMAAAEQLGRTCYGLELDPAYCAVIIQRMEDMGLSCHVEEACA